MTAKTWKSSDIRRLREGFLEIDKDKNGLIDGAELQQLLKQHFGEHAEEADVLAQMPVLDGEDDAIVFEEFVNYLTTDTTLRLDVRFIRHMRQKWEDHLGLQIYIPFLVLFIFFLITEKGLGSGFWQTFALNDLVMGEEFEQSPSLRFEKFYKDINEEKEYWEWFEGPLMGAWWDGPANNFVGGADGGGANMPIGAMKLRQLRVADSECRDRKEVVSSAPPLTSSVGYGITAGDRLNDFPERCFPEWSDGSVDTSGYYATIGGTDVRVTNASINGTFWDIVGDAFSHRGCDNSGLNASAAMLLEGKAGTYACEGYAVILPFSWDGDQVSEVVELLKNGIPVFNPETGEDGGLVKWIDHRTRALSVEMFTYNQNLNLFSRLQYLVEVTAGGSWIPVYSNINFILFQWSSVDFVYHWFTFFFFSFLCFYFISWCNELWKRATDIMVDRRRKGVFARIGSLIAAFTSSFWTVFDFINYVIFFAVWILRFVRIGYGKTDTAIVQNDWFPDEYETVARSTQIIAYLDSINGLMCVGRIFYFLRLNTRFNVLTKTVSRAATELVGLLFIFFILFMGFCLMGYVVFGHVVEDYRDMANTIGTLLRYLVGDFDFVTLRRERRIFAPLFFTLFQVLCFFLLLNMVIAVLSDSFEAVQNAKWKPALLTELMRNTDDDAYHPVRSQMNNFITNSALFREIVYWAKTFVLSCKNLLNRGPEWRATFERESAKNRDENPRLYWAHQESKMVQRKSCVEFKDKLNIFPIKLDDYLKHGGDEPEQDDDEAAFQGVGRDFDTCMSELVMRPAERMERDPQDLLMEMMETHHYWYRDIFDIAEFGWAGNIDLEDDDRVQQLKDLARANDDLYDDDDDDDEDDDDDDDQDELEEEEAQKRLAKDRLSVQVAQMDEVIRRVASVTSNKKNIEDVINNAASAALASRMVRTTVVQRFEEGEPCRLRMHKLIAARYGRYMYEDHDYRSSIKVIVKNDTHREVVTVLQGASESAILRDLRPNFGIEAGVECIITDKEGKVTNLVYQLLTENDEYTITEGTNIIPDWGTVEWVKGEDGRTEVGQGPKTGEWRSTLPEHVVLEKLKKEMSSKSGMIKFTVDEKYFGASDFVDDIDDATEYQQTVHEYPDDHVEEVGCYSQLELIYQPTTIFREHLENVLIYVIRKRLPNLMLSTLTTQELMTLLRVKVKKGGKKNNEPVEL